MEKRQSLIILLLVGVFFSSLSSIFIRLSSATPLSIAAWRMIISGILMVPFYIRARIRGEAAPSGRDLALSALSGLFLAFHFASWVYSLSLTSVASATVLVTIHPVLVAALCFFLFKERVTLKAGGFILITLVGGLVVGLGNPGSASSLWGNLLAFSGAVFVTGYMILGRIVRQRVSMVAYTTVVYLVSAAVLTTMVPLAGECLWPWSWEAFWPIIALAVVSTLMGHSVFSLVLKDLSPTMVSTSILLEPLIASTLAFILFDEAPLWFNYVGAALVLGGLGLFIREQGRKAATEVTDLE